MGRVALTKKELKLIDEAVLKFEEHKFLFEGVSSSLLDAFQKDDELSNYIHFIKSRVKSPKRLRDKLERKYLQQPNSKNPPITADNLFEKINDLAGVRILHLHTDQMGKINEAIIRVIGEQKFLIVEGPIANCWDVEYEQLFREHNIQTKSRDSMYASVHYVIQANKKTKITFELQVRTLMEEVWGEVAHKVGYEDPEFNKSILAQLKVLARLTSGATRLVDCIFHAYDDV